MYYVAPLNRCLTDTMTPASKSPCVDVEAITGHAHVFARSGYVSFSHTLSILYAKILCANSQYKLILSTVLRLYYYSMLYYIKNGMNIIIFLFLMLHRILPCWSDIHDKHDFIVILCAGQGSSVIGFVNC